MLSLSMRIASSLIEDEAVAVSLDEAEKPAAISLKESCLRALPAVR